MLFLCETANYLQVCFLCILTESKEEYFFFKEDNKSYQFSNYTIDLDVVIEIHKII